LALALALALALELAFGLVVERAFAGFVFAGASRELAPWFPVAGP